MRPDTPALLLSANCSIGDKSKHITSDELYELFMAIGKRKLSALEKYIIEIIQTEAGEEEVQNFQNRYEIPSSQVKALLECSPYANFAD